VTHLGKSKTVMVAALTPIALLEQLETLPTVSSAQTAAVMGAAQQTLNF